MATTAIASTDASPAIVAFSHPSGDPARGAVVQFPSLESAQQNAEAVHKQLFAVPPVARPTVDLQESTVGNLYDKASRFASSAADVTGLTAATQKAQQATVEDEAVRGAIGAHIKAGEYLSAAHLALAHLNERAKQSVLDSPPVSAIDAQVNQAQQAFDKNQTPIERVGRGIAAVTPIIGPMTAQIAEKVGTQVGSRDYAGAAGSVAGAVAPALLAGSEGEASEAETPAVKTEPAVKTQVDAGAAYLSRLRQAIKDESGEATIPGTGKPTGRPAPTTDPVASVSDVGVKDLLKSDRGEMNVPLTGKTPVEANAPNTSNAPNTASGGQRVGQRVPTSVKAAQGHNPDLIVDMDAVRDAAVQNPEYMSKLAAKLDYPAMKYEKGLTPEEKLNSFIKQAAGNVEWLHNRVPEDIRDVSKGWYDSANSMTKKWAQDNGYTHEQTAGVTAVLSPQNPWDNNISLAQRVIDAMKNRQEFNWTPEMDKTARELGKQSFNLNKYARLVRGKTLSEIQHANPDMQNAMKAMWIRIYDEAHNPRAFDRWAPDGTNRGTALTASGKPANSSWFSLDPIAKAVSILEDGSMDNIHERLGQQHKVRNFYNNIIDPNSNKGDVTIDTHAVAVGHLSPLSLNSDEVNHNFGGTSDAGQGLNGTYPLYAEAYRQAAKKLGVLPRELQSITWEGIRSLFREKTPEIQSTVKDIWSQHQRGEITLNQARQKIIKAAGGFKNPDWQTTSAPTKKPTAKPIAENAPWKNAVMSLAQPQAA